MATALKDQFKNEILSTNTNQAYLIEESLKLNIGKLGPHGELVVETGKHTGRAAEDKYVVRTEITENDIWWENNINQMSEETFLNLKKDVITYLNSQSKLYYSNRSIGSEKHFSLGIELVSPRPSAILFSTYMFKENINSHNDTYSIIHAPEFTLDPKKYGTKSETVIVTCFKNKTTIIIGTKYAGEIKKSMFSIMNFLLPKKDVLPMHSGANQKSNGESFVFFGLSGTGKTTLSTDEGTYLIGDDEHGLSDKGLFNFENGCYAKTYKLGKDTEPSIYEASTQFASFLENVSLSEDQTKIDFFDGSKTENGRSSYPLTFIKDRVESGTGAIPKHIFFLSADAFGVLPPVAKLTNEQAMDYFVLGYTAKLAGTEVGVKSPKATFSPCFGAPFMLLHPTKYAALLSKYIEKYNINVWLVNTGWYGGGFGVGERFPLKITRRIIRAIQNNELENAKFNMDEIFKFQVPQNIEGIETKILNPNNAWSDPVKYQEEAKKLFESFNNQLKKFKN